ncbi:hypothetical protein [Methylorubrum extorquens]|uniref:hypothetical protein n=1 Tax=Methylorubrum extorquens TaxID=408 RepID=UPI0022378673|nr:hypothetical protein [Methylorubrum extorquens]UYW33663.1 hypothetical protein OKB92_06155 [Methylorubrum extorquens]
MSTPTPTPVALLALQAVAIGSCDAALSSVGLPTYSSLLARSMPRAPSELPEGVVSLDAARANRPSSDTVGRRL